jgi:hypothetical protein
VLPLLYTESEIDYTGGGRPVVRIAFIGLAGIGSEGNHHGEQMRAVIRKVVEQANPRGLIIDLRSLDYQFGDWIGTCCLHPACSSAAHAWWQWGARGRVSAHSGSTWSR